MALKRTYQKEQHDIVNDSTQTIDNPASGFYVIYVQEEDASGEHSVLVKYNDAGSVTTKTIPFSDHNHDTSYAAVDHNHAAGDIVSGTFSDALVAASNVTQHEGSLSIGWSQLTSIPLDFNPTAHNHSGSDITSGTVGAAYLPTGTVINTNIGSDATYELKVTGDIGASGDVVAYVSSDRRLKDNIKPISSPLDKIEKLNGVEWDWNENQKVYSGHDYGVIAQEVKEVFPELVIERENGYLGVKYDRLVGVLIEGIKELRAEVEQLKAEK